MKNVYVYQYVNGISLNGKEYLLDGNGLPLTFESNESAIKFLLDNGVNESEIDNGIFISESCDYIIYSFENDLNETINMKYSELYNIILDLVSSMILEKEYDIVNINNITLAEELTGITSFVSHNYTFNNDLLLFLDNVLLKIKKDGNVK